MRELIIDYLDGNLSGELKEFVASHIKKTDKWKLEFEQLQEVHDVIDSTEPLDPPAGMKQEFEKLLREANDEPEKNYARQISWPSGNFILRIAASITVLVAAFLIGYKLNTAENDEEIAALKAEMATTKQLVLNSLENQSASSRLNAVNVSSKFNTIDDEITTALVQTLNNDPNANVRLAAMDALARFGDDQNVRKSLVESLARQDQPIVQIALINLLVNMKEEGAKSILENMANNADMAPAVRDEASFGLIRL